MALGGRNRWLLERGDKLRIDSRLPVGPSKHGPQSFITAMLHDDVIALTTGRRALQLSTIPKRSGTYFAPYKPGTAQRIPPLADRANPNNVRRTLVARTQLLLTKANQ